jgi:hypothetical protein
VAREDLCELAKVVCRAGPARRKASEPQHGAAVVDREVVAVFLPDAKGVVPVGKVYGDKIVARAGEVAEILQSPGKFALAILLQPYPYHTHRIDTPIYLRSCAIGTEPSDVGESLLQNYSGDLRFAYTKCRHLQFLAARVT